MCFVVVVVVVTYGDVAVHYKVKKTESDNIQPGNSKCYRGNVK